MIPSKFRIAAALFAFAAVFAAQAEQSISAGDYAVHYSAVSAASITPEVARQYGITRSASRGLLNIAVRRKQADGQTQAVAATVTAAATNLAGQRQQLQMREVREGEAIYYLGEPRVEEAASLNFEIEVQPSGSAQPISLRFSQDFFAPR